jgi:Cu(I)/Ag(I) efflux system membrane fusion protein/cobalt-zinc-cadmium efflux system membrane fusion protein
MEFSTTPSPPSKGKNTVRVELTESNAPLTGAQVTVTFFMPAMPAMGMSAMRTVVKVEDKGNGVYQGMGELQTGGTWQVTIVAQKNGLTLATKQFTVNAEGGM